MTESGTQPGARRDTLFGYNDYHTYWLNPYPPGAWDREDSLMRVYTPYCKRVYECRNLQQLARIARSVFKGRKLRVARRSKL